ENDIASLTNIFGVQAPDRYTVYVKSVGGTGASFHYRCDNTTIYASSPDPQITRALTIAEIVETLSAAKNNGWNCTEGNGESLSLELAGDMIPMFKPYVQAAQSLWRKNRSLDYVSTNVPTDRNNDANG